MFPDITVNFNQLANDIAALTPWGSFWFFFSHGGWAIILYYLFKGLWMYWVFYIRMSWADQQKFVLLAIDVPRNNEQTPVAVENIFSAIAGVHGTETLWEEYWHGEFQLSVTFEIVSIDGYVQYVVHTPIQFRDIIESAVYAQYPDAEIHEIDDYTKNVPKKWPHPDWEYFGFQYGLHKPSAYPIRTHHDFEDSISGEFKDPMASLLEVMSSLQPGEQIWIQWVTTAIDDKWKHQGEEIVNSIIKRKKPHKETLLDKILGVPITLLSWLSDALLGAGEGGGHAEKPANADATVMLHLPPGEKEVVEKIEKKMAKIGFFTKCRVMYIARKEVYKKVRSKMMMGALKQFNTIDCNRFAIQKKIWTKTYYAFAKWRKHKRQTKLMKGYSVRSDGRNGPGFIFNIEELATVWHFPVMQVKAPLLRKAESKRAEPPFTLPLAVPRVFRSKEQVRIDAEEEAVATASPAEAPVTESAPENLPYVS